MTVEMDERDREMLAILQDGLPLTSRPFEVVADLRGERMLRGSRTAPVGEAHELGRALAGELIGQGASEILAELGPPPGDPRRGT